MKITNIGAARAVVFEYKNNEVYYLLFNGYALFEITDKYGNDYMEKMTVDGEESFNMILGILTILSKQGELARRAIGLEATETFEPVEIDLLTISPAEILAFKSICLDAITLGFRREITDKDEEIDLGLVELQKKNPGPERNT
jgi:hypothetical protein